MGENKIKNDADDDDDDVQIYTDSIGMPNANLLVRSIFHVCIYVKKKKGRYDMYKNGQTMSGHDHHLRIHRLPRYSCMQSIIVPEALQKNKRQIVSHHFTSCHIMSLQQYHIMIIHTIITCRTKV